MPFQKKLLFLFVLSLSLHIQSQSESDYISLLLSEDLKSNANAVVRFERKTVEINDFDNMTIKTHRIVTVLNKYGERHLNTVEFYDDNTDIKKIEARVYNEFGEEIRKVRKSDFTDQSAVSGGTLYSDSRVMYFDYNAVSYPYTVEFISEVHHNSTAFVPSWYPIDGFYLAIEYAEFRLINNSSEEVKIKKRLLEEFDIQEVSEYHFRAKNLKGIKYEAYCPTISEIAPGIKLALKRFNLDGVEGINNDWSEFGTWVQDKLLSEANNLPETAIEEVKKLTEGVEDKLERAKIVYNYMQDRTRYISVQIGIGGWKPMEAEEVDQLGYGDCKGLTNYTKELLQAVDVPSYYTLVYGGKEIRDIDAEFSSAQGNHAILCIENNDENIFLECTSQTAPFGFISGFTDDRDVLIIKPSGGEIVHTKAYSAEESQQITTANAKFDASGNFTADIKIASTGYQYNTHEGIQNESSRNQDLHYKEYWDNINDLSLDAVTFNNDKDNVIFTEQVKVSANRYASKSGTRLILQPNLFNRLSSVPQRYLDRKHNFKIDRALKDVDEYIIEFPMDLKIEAMGEGKSMSTKFGSYEFKLEKLNDNKIKYTRTLILNKGEFAKSEYKSYRDFWKNIVKNDKTKMVLISN